jgi:bacillolysin
MAGLERFHFNVVDERPATRGAAFGGRRSEVPPEADVDPSFTSDEAAARFHLSRLLAADSRPAVRGVTAPERPERVPDLHVLDTKDQPGLETKLVRFEQTQDEIPVFGARAVCELTQERGFVSASGRVGKVEGVSSFPTVSQEKARTSIVRFAEVEPETLESIAPARLNFFEDQQGAWHLVWLFENVPAAPPDFLEETRGHGLGGSPRTRNPLVDYLIDAHSAEVVFHFSATPLFAVPPLPVPVLAA